VIVGKLYKLRERKLCFIRKDRMELFYIVILLMINYTNKAVNREKIIKITKKMLTITKKSTTMTIQYLIK